MEEISNLIAWFIGIVFILLAIIAYLVPTIFAFYRGHQYKWIITAINIILGITGVGWLLAFTWAVWPEDSPSFRVFISSLSTGNLELAKETYNGIKRQVIDYKASSIRQSWSSELLKQYNDLKNSGIITDEELTKRKKELLFVQNTDVNNKYIWLTILTSYIFIVALPVMTKQYSAYLGMNLYSIWYILHSLFLLEDQKILKTSRNKYPPFILIFFPIIYQGYRTFLIKEKRFYFLVYSAPFVIALASFALRPEVPALITTPKSATVKMPASMAISEQQAPVASEPIDLTTATATPETTSISAPIIANNSIKLVSRMLDFAINDNSNNTESSIEEIQYELDNLPKPIKGDKKAARKINNEGLLQFNSNHFDNAVTFFTKAHNLDPSDIEIVNNLGYALLKQHSLDSAEQVLMSTIALSPKRVPAWTNLADLYAVKGDIKHAIAAYSYVFRYSSNKVRIYQYMKKLNDNENVDALKQARIQAMILAEKTYPEIKQLQQAAQQ